MKKIIIASVILLFGCKNSEVSQSEKKDLEKLVETELGEPTSSDSNTSKTYTLYRIEENNHTNYSKIKYLIVDNTKAEIVKKGFITMGYIKWLNNNQIEILDIPGVMPSNKTMADYKSIINLNQ